ncbi:uncharacterized protein LOC126844608 [Adelges cooleyi]|uniref:uncharacterized protein LOC126844608 n=1 Tax=Adelges cooleyi TaxID=133065 RepID=UPI00218066FA|nr:uncharacterized protein LOC126844608 [Adelges cooleyi]
MKIFCVLTTFFLVLVLADIKSDILGICIKMVSKSNIKIEKASNYNNENGNGLEYAITRIVYGGWYSIDELNCMITVPEYVDTDSIKTIQNSIRMQKNLQKDIDFILGVSFFDAENKKVGKMVKLIEERRFRTTQQLKTSIFHASTKIQRLEPLGEARRRFVEKALKNIIARKLAENEAMDKMICYLIALWISTKTVLKTPAEYKRGDCIIEYKTDHNIQYRSIQDKIWQVDVNDNDIQIKELTVQLQEEYFRV